MNRRGFLQHSAAIAGAFCLDFPAFAEKVATFGQPRLKMGIISDIHIRTREDLPVFQHTLEYFRDKGVDGVIIAGDMADWSLESQLEWVAETWYKVFPKDKAPDGRHVEKVFVYGNHDIKTAEMILKKYKVTKEQAEREAIGPRRAEIWKRLFKEKWAPIYIKDIKGYKFIGAHFANWENIPGLEEFFAEHKKELPQTKPFFYVQHMHPKDTCSAPWTWGQDDGTTTRFFKNFPNLVTFTGHSHTTLTDERTIWQGGFTSVGTASLSYIFPFGGRENTHPCGSKEKEPSQMKDFKGKDGKHGQLMTVYDDCITLQRHEFVYDQDLADNWVIPLPLTGDAPLAFEPRAKAAKAPQFAAGDKVTLTRAEGKDRYGKKEKQITVHFPTVLRKRTGVRAFDYEVQAEIADVDHTKIVCTKRVFSYGFYLAEAQDEKEAICVFAESELPRQRRLRFQVRPVECFGKKGEPIYSEWLSADSLK